ncbi:MAG TPA: Ig-like domain-containing protein [Solirubrobacterales bacterium]|nr:Ig-like domain-containing protein [Solirubrobacterales bacterium]
MIRTGVAVAAQAACLLASAAPAIAGQARFDAASIDGDYAFFETGEPMLAGDANDSTNDVYQRAFGSTTLMTPGPSSAEFAGISADGSHVFFTTPDQLVAGDTDSAIDIYDNNAGTIKLVSTGPSGGNSGVEPSGPSVSDDGDAFFTTTESLVSADTDSQADIYKRSGNTTTLISTGPDGGNGPFFVRFEGMSDDGSRVFFTTDESLVAADSDGNAPDLYERSNGTTALIPGGSASFPTLFAGLSADGTHLYFTSTVRLAAADTDNTRDLYDQHGGSVDLVSTGPADGGGPSFEDFEAASTDGSRVFFSTYEALVAADTDGSHIDVYERSGGNTTLVSVGSSGQSAESLDFNGASADGSRVFFETFEQLTPADTDTQQDTYERQGNTTTLITDGPGAADAFSEYVGNSVDGTKVFFTTDGNLTAGDTDNGRFDLYQRSGGTTTLLSTGPNGGSGPFDAGFASASEDGGHVFFETQEQLVGIDNDSQIDVYEWSAGTTRLVSTAVPGDDTRPPETTIDSGPSGATNDSTPTFTFSSDEQGTPGHPVTFECRVDAEPFEPCSGPGDSHTTDPLGDGSHTFEVRASDPAGNTDPTPAIRSFSVDTQAPETFFTSGPNDVTADDTPTFTFGPNEPGSSFECRIDGGRFEPCSGPGASHTPDSLPDGYHLIEVRATDAAGNRDPDGALRIFRVDTDPPETSAISGPSGRTTDRTPTFEFESDEQDVAFQCSLDGEPLAPCTSPVTRNVGKGKHSFVVVAVDAAGNEDGTPVEFRFKVKKKKR